MNKGVFFRIFVCVLFFGFCLYSYLDLQNEITQLRIQIPALMGEVRRMEEENTHFQYKIERFESPENLLNLAKSAAYSHLKFPICSEVISMRQGDSLQGKQEPYRKTLKKQPNITFATGAGQSFSQ